MTEANAQGAAGRRPTRRDLLRWAGWFGIINAGLYALIALRYLFAQGMPKGLAAQIYTLCVYLTHFAILGMLPLMLVISIVVLVYPRRRVAMTFAVLIASSIAALLVLDTNIFAQYRFHLSALTVVIFETSTWFLFATVLLVALAFESVMAGTTWARFGQRSTGRPGVWLGAALAAFWLAGQGLHIWADAMSYSPITSLTRALPLYFPMKAKRTMARIGLLDPAELEQRRLLSKANPPDSGQLRYPLAPLECDSDAKPATNLLIVLIDALRPDEVNERQTPNIEAFKRESLFFEKHFSGGNSSRMGIFSLFYGLPSTYWQSFYGLQREPVLMEQLDARDYENALFSAVGFGSPSNIDRTVFAGLPSVSEEAEGLSLVELNRNVTSNWRGWIAAHDPARPFFGFLYYDPGIREVTTDQPSSSQAAPVDEVQRRRRMYRAGLELLDSQVADVLQSLDDADLTERTVVIITGDHGYEFDDNGLGYIGHASNFSAVQLRTPLMIRWPGREPRVYSQRSSHHDLPATLLQDMLGCRNSSDEYSSGHNLFAGHSWDWIIAGSYTSHAIVQPDQVVVTYPGGFIEILGSDYRPDPELQLDAGLMQEAMLEMRRFYR